MAATFKQFTSAVAFSMLSFTSSSSFFAEATAACMSV
jgi:hypothetical protein